MTKRAGMGDNFYIDGYDVSGDVNSLSNVHGGPAPWEVTGIDKSAVERIGLLRDGGLGFVSFFNDANVAPLGAFQVLKTLPTVDRQCSYFRGTAIGNAAASLMSKQINYDGNRGNDGSFTFSTDVQGNGFGLEWGEQLTAGKRTDVTATSPATGQDSGVASTAFGWTAYLHVFAFTGTSVTVTLQDSADNSSFAAFTGSAFTAATGLTQQRLTGAPTATVRRYVRAVTTGVFTNAVFAVNFVRYLTAQT
jgi:hypothetical protein